MGCGWVTDGKYKGGWFPVVKCVQMTYGLITDGKYKGVGFKK